MMDIEKLKEEIHKADKDLADAFLRRMEAVKGIAEYKKAHGISAEDTIHDQPIVDSDAGFIEDPEIRSYFVPFLKSALKASKTLQNTMMAGQRIAYCGGMDPKDYTVAGNAFPGRTRVAYPNYVKTYQAVVDGECDVCVIPFEKSNTGEIGQVLDMMFAGDLFINKVVTVENESDTVRYAIMSRVENDTVPAGADNRFMIMFTVKDEPGSLAKAISTLSSYGHNMSIMRSRHMPDLPWHYYFYAEAEGDVTTADGKKMFADMQKVCQTVKMLGCYEAV
jgi:prephenate dehydratase